jgi:hypothetical protein
MSRYFFHIRDGLIFVPDEEGMELRTMMAVEEEARASAQDTVNAALRARAAAVPASIEIEDEQRNKVCRDISKPLVH